MDNVVVGNLCGDPVLRQPRRGGQPVARFTVAVNGWRRVGDQFVERPTVFHRVVCFGALAENVSNSLGKGMEVLVAGRWVDDSFLDEQGQRQVRHAMEAKIVGPALRRATASVTRVARPPDGAEPSDDTARASPPGVGCGPESTAAPHDVAAGRHGHAESEAVREVATVG